MTVEILGVPGSLRAGSYNRALLVEAARLAPAGVRVRVFEGLGAIPPFSEDLEPGPVPPAVGQWRDAIVSADGLLIATPQYNGSVPGQLKNALDWASRPDGAGALAGKPAATLSASPGARGASWAQADLRKILTVTGATVVGSELTVGGAPQVFDGAGRLRDDAIAAGLTSLLGALAGGEPAG